MRLFPKSHFAAANVKKKMKFTKKLPPLIQLNTLINKILIFFKKGDIFANAIFIKQTSCVHAKVYKTKNEAR